MVTVVVRPHGSQIETREDEEVALRWPVDLRLPVAGDHFVLHRGDDPDDVRFSGPVAYVRVVVSDAQTEYPSARVTIKLGTYLGMPAAVGCGCPDQAIHRRDCLDRRRV